MEAAILSLLNKKGSEIANLFGVEAIAVDTFRGYFPIFKKADMFDCRLRDALYALGSGNKRKPRSFVLYDLDSETTEKPGRIILAVKNGAPLNPMDRETAIWACHILGYHNLPDNDLDALIESYNTEQKRVRQH